MNVSISSQQSGKPIQLTDLIEAKPIGRFHLKVIALCFLIIFLDGFDTTLIGFIAPALVLDWHIDRHALGPVVSAALLGIALGSFAAGPIADRYGRKLVLVGGVLLFAVMTLATPFASDLYWMSVLRLLTGLGLGATIPNACTLASEYAPHKHRAAIVTTVLCGFTIGSAAGGFASSWVLRYWGWQGVLFACGGAALLLVPLLMAQLPESLHFLIKKGNSATRIRSILGRFAPEVTTDQIKSDSCQFALSSNPVAAIVSTTYRLSTLALWCAFFMASFAVYILIGWLPMLVTDAGFTVADAAMTAGVFQTGGAIGVILQGRAMDRWNAHCVLAGAYFGSALLIFLLGGAGSHLILLMAYAGLAGFCIAGANSGIFALAAMSYPPAMRATGISWMSGVGRFGAILSGFVGAQLLGSGWNLLQVTGMLTVPVFIAAVSILVKWKVSHKSRRLVTRTGSHQDA
ncbi:aromatic acid/H+ symport family MFS transporter [Pseudomonas sp. MF6767]|uniref:MFS transporter n=1 Tax=Pseudomonas sp. MF6767 TaxID=2797531 RepID=UPI0018E72FA4|nr:aromatic acid/H+ symport family MFS transporter [Pseudomonas sp. MF6767]MBJ2281690.1 aromatic acid/H+ symport family MFS transporter [Pseudomonas sp. MF6767]